MSTPDRAEISRRNGQKSMGPKTAEGKNRSRLNALKHGMTASLPVLPGEDGNALQGRIAAWTEDLEPRSLLEGHFIGQAAQVSWQLDRIERAHVARLTTNILAAQDGESQPGETAPDIAALGARLFSDRRGPIQLYSTYEYLDKKEPRTSWSGLADDPDSPARLVKQLESTLAGCGWMQDRWAELRKRLEPGTSWQSPDKLKAIRLLGKQPLDAADDADVATLFLACYTIDPHHESAFHELRRETTDWEWKNYQQRLDKRVEELTCPSGEIQARAVLTRIVDRATVRLEEKAEALRQRAELVAKLTADRLSFDDSPEGERLRRYQTTCSRSLHKAIDSIMKMRLVAKDRDSMIENERGPIAAIEVDHEFPFDHNPATPSIDHPIVLTTSVVGQTEIMDFSAAPQTDTQSLRDATTMMEDPILRNEPGTTAERPIMRNEPDTTPERPILRNEPGTTPERPIMRNEPGTTPELARSAGGDPGGGAPLAYASGLYAPSAT